MATREHYALRPMTDDDLDIVFRWRNSEQVRPFMYTTHEISETEHLAWWARVQGDPTKRYSFFEMDGRPIGFSSVVDIDTSNGTASWGFYIGAEDAPQGSGSVMEFLTLEEAFGPLHIRKLTCEVLAFNERSLKMNRKFGYVQEGVLRAHKLHDGTYEDVVLLALFADGWPATAERLAPIVFRE